MRRLNLRYDPKQDKNLIYLFDDGTYVFSELSLVDKLKIYLNNNSELEQYFFICLERTLKEDDYVKFISYYDRYTSAAVRIEEGKQRNLLSAVYNYEEDIENEHLMRKFLLPVSKTFKPYALSAEYEKFIGLDQNRWLSFNLFNFVSYLRIDFGGKFICFESDTCRFIFNFQMILSNDKYFDKLYQFMLYSVEDFSEFYVPGIDLQYQVAQPMKPEWIHYISKYIEFYIGEERKRLEGYDLKEFFFTHYSQIQTLFKDLDSYYCPLKKLSIEELEDFMDFWIKKIGVQSMPDGEMIDIIYNPLWLYSAHFGVTDID